MNTSMIHWLGHASFRIEAADRQIYIDPWKIPASSPPASLILITHSHYDHCSEEDVLKVRTHETVIAGPPSVAAALPVTVHTVEPGKRYVLAGLEVETVPAYNVGKSFHKQQEAWVGYIIQLPSGERVYHAGDTDKTEAMRDLKVDIALLPCGGTYTMTAAEAAEAASLFKPGVLIPMHWGDIVGSRTDAERVRSGYPSTVILEAEGQPATRVRR